jgi:hypothetical protein
MDLWNAFDLSIKAEDREDEKIRAARCFLHRGRFLDAVSGTPLASL